MTPSVIQQLKDQVPALQGRVYGAAALAALTAQDAMPNVTPCVHVMPSGIHAAADPAAMSGVYTHVVQRGIAAFLSLRIHDPNGAAALDEASTIIDAIIAGLAGWELPGGSIGVFVFRHAVLRAFDRGQAIYEISFTISDQLRISR